MKKIIFSLLLFSLVAFGQQINYTFGETVLGVPYLATGAPNTDSTATVSVMFDMQDYYYLDFNPLVSDTSGAVVSNSNRQYFGTFWLYIDAENATDSVNYYVKAKEGNRVYIGRDKTNSNLIHWNSSPTLIADTTRAVNDVQWIPYNIYFESFKHLPPEFIRVDIAFNGTTGDSLDVYWRYAYPALYESEQSNRSSTQSNDAKKNRKSLD